MIRRTPRSTLSPYTTPFRSFDLNFTDGNTHQVALYCVDYESAGRAQRIDVSDANNGALLDTRNVTAFSGGQYLVWTLGGHVKLTITTTGSLNVVGSALFFGD